MGNIIKIPTLNTDLNLRDGSQLLNSQNWTVVDGEINGEVYANTANYIPTTTNGNGNGLAILVQLLDEPNFQLSADTNLQAIGYEVGDVITLTIPSGTPNLFNENGFTLQTTVTQAMFSFEGDKVQYAPVFHNGLGLTLTVIPPPDGTYDYWQVAQISNSHSNAWRINISGGNADNRVRITRSINEAFRKAFD